MKAPILGRASLLTDQKVSVIAHVAAMNAQALQIDPQKPLYTGRYFAVLKPGVKNFKKSNRQFEQVAGFRVADSADFAVAAAANDADVLVYEHLGLALLGGDESQIGALEAADNEYLLVPEKVVYVPEDIDFIATGVEQTLISTYAAVQSVAGMSTWGLLATNAINAAYTGKGVKICILDTGFDDSHPDFVGRNITRASFVPGESPDDGHGHGTHCIGTACGYKDPSGLRYGISYESQILAGKVLSNAGSGAQQFILDGITWAANNGAQIISMSLGSPVFPGMGHDIVYERAAQYANSKGAVIVAAAGNESRRSIGIINPVGSPADCPSILAVGALDSGMNVADFSCGSINPGAQVDIAAPGVGILSSWPMPLRYRNISGTSMATPHVAGILGLFWEQYPSYNYQQITAEMFKFAKRLAASSTDVGHGLVMAP